MTNPQKNKGDAAEREIASKLTELVGQPIRRKLGAGRMDDEGDLEGVDNWTFEVKNYSDIARAVNVGLTDSEKEQANAGTPFGAALIRRRGGRWFAAMTLEQFAAAVKATR